MKVEEIYPEKIISSYDMVVVENGEERCYTRHGVNSWSFFISLYGEDYDVDGEKAKQLEALFQEYKELV